MNVTLANTIDFAKGSLNLAKALAVNYGGRAITQFKHLPVAIYRIFKFVYSIFSKTEAKYLVLYNTEKQVNESFKKIKKIGQGGYGKVYLVSDINNNLFAIKKQSLDIARHEYSIGHQLNYSSVVSFYSFFERQDKKTKEPKGFISMEYITGIKLLNYLEKQTLNSR